MAEMRGEPLMELPPSVLTPRRRPLGAARLPATGSASLYPLFSESTPSSSIKAASPPADRQVPTHLRIALGYLIFAILCQLLLLVPTFGLLRIPLRMGPFLASVLLAMFPPKRLGVQHRLHPAMVMAVTTVAIVLFGLFHPETDSLMAGAAAIMLHIAILSPLIWAGRLQLSPRGFEAIVFTLWAFSSLSAGVGVVQVLFPGKYMPAPSEIYQNGNLDAQESFRITLANGSTLYRPMGLTDSPGGAAPAGVAAFVLGLGLLVASESNRMRALYLLGMGAGLFVVYLSQVRVSLVMCGVATTAFVIIMTLRGEFKRLTGSPIALAVVVALSTTAAFSIGGSMTTDRLFTLVEEDAGTVYYTSRGRFLEYTFYYALPTYPVGAGLGRYGMTNHYFGRERGMGNNTLWAEIQWTAWAYDGGWLMVIAYPAALLVALWSCFKIGFSRRTGPMGLWGAILFSYDVAAFAVIFSYSLFVSQAGLEFWLLNAALFSAAQLYLKSLNPEVPEGFEMLPAPWRPGASSGPAGTAPATPSRPARRPLQHPPLPDVVPVFKQVDAPEASA